MTAFRPSRLNRSEPAIFAPPVVPQVADKPRNYLVLVAERPCFISIAPAERRWSQAQVIGDVGGAW